MACYQILMIFLLMMICCSQGLKLLDPCGKDTEKCPKDSSCTIRGCDGTICLCEKGLMPNRNYTQCVRISELGETCNESSHCRGLSSRCHPRQRTCLCQNGYISSKPNRGITHCKQKPLLSTSTMYSLLHENCDGNRTKCSTNYNLRCDTLQGVCVCDNGYKEATRDIINAYPFNVVQCVPAKFSIGIDIAPDQCFRPSPGLNSSSSLPLSTPEYSAGSFHTQIVSTSYDIPSLSTDIGQTSPSASLESLTYFQPSTEIITTDYNTLKYMSSIPERQSSTSLDISSSVVLTTTAIPDTNLHSTYSEMISNTPQTNHYSMTSLSPETVNPISTLSLVLSTPVFKSSLRLSTQSNIVPTPSRLYSTTLQSLSNIYSSSKIKRESDSFSLSRSFSESKSKHTSYISVVSSFFGSGIFESSVDGKYSHHTDFTTNTLTQISSKEETPLLSLSSTLFISELLPNSHSFHSFSDAERTFVKSTFTSHFHIYSSLVNSVDISSMNKLNTLSSYSSHEMSILISSQQPPHSSKHVISTIQQPPHSSKHVISTIQQPPHSSMPVISTMPLTISQPAEHSATHAISTTPLIITPIGEKCTGDTCPEHSSCVDDSCNSTRCLCDAGYVPNADKKLCYQIRKLGQSCQTHQQCIGPNVICENHVCVCREGFYESSNGKRCRLGMSWFIHFPLLGDKCSEFFSACYNYDEQVCVDGRCSCKDGYRVIEEEINAYHKLYHQCLLNSTKQGIIKSNNCGSMPYLEADPFYSKAEQRIGVMKGAIIGGTLAVIVIIVIVVIIICYIRYKRRTGDMHNDSGSEISFERQSSGRYSFRIPRPFATYDTTTQADDVSYHNKSFRDDETNRLREDELKSLNGTLAKFYFDNIDYKSHDDGE